jgi:hypothetical protein
MAFLHPNPGTEISNLKVTNAESFRNDEIISPSTRAPALGGDSRSGFRPHGRAGRCRGLASGAPLGRLINPQAVQQISQSGSAVKGTTGVDFDRRRLVRRHGGELGGGIKECLSGIIECVFEFDRRGGI